MYIIMKIVKTFFLISSLVFLFANGKIDHELGKLKNKDVTTYLKKCDKDIKGKVPEFTKCLNPKRPKTKKGSTAKSIFRDVNKCIGKIKKHNAK